MLAQIGSAAVVGMEAVPVLVEVHVGNGLPSTTFVGLPDTAVREAKDRVRAALAASGLSWPGRRITVNLAPADVPKLGSAFDLPIALGLLVATGDIDAASMQLLWAVGELGLDGSIRAAPGLLAIAREARRAEVGLVCSTESVTGLMSSEGLELRPAASISELVVRLRNGGIPRADPQSPLPAGHLPAARHQPDFAEVGGQAEARRGIEIAAAGGFNLMLHGPPGSGKTMLARRLPTILPFLSTEQAMEVELIHSLVGSPRRRSAWFDAPFRAPHHSTSVAALVGGGSAVARPGEVTLAHHGVLFLDELSLFSAPALDALRQPLEDGEVRIARSRAMVRYPARPMVIAATNPCPCGVISESAGKARMSRFCSCSEASLNRHFTKLSGPLIDRFDIALHVGRCETEAVVAGATGESSEQMRGRVALAREAQAEILGPGRLARDIPGPEIGRHFALDKACRRALGNWAETGGLSARRIHRALRVASVIAVSDGREQPAAADVDEAVSLWRPIPRRQDR